MTTAHNFSPAPDPSEDFRQAIADVGLHPPKSIVGDGRIYRFASNGKKRGDDSGWYVFYLDGVPSGTFGCWRGGFKHTWCAKDPRKLTIGERAEQRQRITAAREQRQKEEDAERAKCRERSEEILSDAKPADPAHPYLVAKQVKPFDVLQVDRRLVVPLRDAAGVLHGVQFIGADGRKLFLLGTASAAASTCSAMPATPPESSLPKVSQRLPASPWRPVIPSRWRSTRAISCRWPRRCGQICPR